MAKTIGVLFVAMTLMTAFHRAAAADELQYPDYVSNILSGIDGIVQGAEQHTTIGRAFERAAIIRNVVALQLNGNLSDATKIQLSVLTNESVLCAVRGSDAAIANDRSYLSLLSTKITTTATQSKIDTLTAALSALGQSYSIDLNQQKTYDQIRDLVQKNCKDDLNNVSDFAQSYFGTSFLPSAPGVATAAPSLFDILSASGSPVSALITAINAIVTPIVTGLVGMIDEQKRMDAITDFLKADKDQIGSALVRLAKVSDSFSRDQRMEALGRFSIQMAIIRQTRFDKCVPAPSSPFSSPSPHSTARPMADDFLACYAAVWRKVANPVASALKAADDYDQLADAAAQISDDDLKEEYPNAGGPAEAAAMEIKKQLAEVGVQRPKAFTEVWSAALKLLTFAETVNNALSLTNRDNVRKAIDNLVKEL